MGLENEPFSEQLKKSVKYLLLNLEEYRFKELSPRIQRVRRLPAFPLDQLAPALCRVLIPALSCRLKVLLRTVS